MEKHFNTIAPREANMVERNYAITIEALATKPEILTRILEHSRQQSNQDIVIALNKGHVVKFDVSTRLKLAEIEYQDAIEKSMNAIYALYQILPIDQKVDLLIYAEEIAQINDKARQKARDQMQHDRIALIEARQEEIAKQTATSLHIGHEKQPFLPKPEPLNKTQLQHKALSADKPAPATESAKVDIPKTPSAEIPASVNEKPLVNQVGLGSPAAFTLNLPFTHIPGLPGLNQILKKIDRTTHFDLGFTAKGMADRAPNLEGGKDLVYKLSYIGFGVMSSKANTQISPISLKLEDSQDQDKWGASASVFTKQHSDGLGSKYTLNANDSDAGLSYAHEYSYQKPSNKFISTLTAGRFLGTDVPIIRIPARQVPKIERIIEALPSKEETTIILDRIDKVIPASQAYQIATSIIEKIATLTPSALAATKQLLEQVEQSGLPESAQQAVIERICENCAANYKNDTSLRNDDKAPQAQVISHELP
ncbi:MAG: hypothetical protein WBL28_12210 [Methylotenera sp.]